jgi:hypothetical protein
VKPDNVTKERCWVWAGMENRVLSHRTEGDSVSDSRLYNGLPTGHEIPHPHPPTIHNNTGEQLTLKP